MKCYLLHGMRSDGKHSNKFVRVRLRYTDDHKIEGRKKGDYWDFGTPDNSEVYCSFCVKGLQKMYEEKRIPMEVVLVSKKQLIPEKMLSI